MNDADSARPGTGNGPDTTGVGASRPAGATGAEPGSAPGGSTPAAAPASGGGSSASGGAPANPFADLAAGDITRDVVAVTLLLISFGMPWDAFDSATGLLYVVFATLISIASVALPYLRRGGVLPSGWSDGALRTARLVANVPYAVVVIVTLVLGYVGGAAGQGSGDGLGVGVAFGTAGAILAAQPRSSERPSETSDAALWRLTVGVLGALVAVLTLISLVFVLIDSEGSEWADLVFVIVFLLFFAAVALIPVGRLLNGDAAARDVLVVLGVVGLLASFWMLGGAAGVGVWSLRYAGPVIVFWPALAAAASAVTLPLILHVESGSQRWITLARHLFQLAAIAMSIAALLAAVTIARDDVGRGTEITLLVIVLLAVAAALVGRNALAHDPKAGRPTALVAAGMFVVVGIVYAAVAANSPAGFDSVAAVVVSIFFVFAAAVACALLVPGSVRETLGPVGAVSPSFLRSGRGATPKPSDDPGHQRQQPNPDDPEATVLATGLVDEVSQHTRESATPRTSSAIGADDATRVDMRAEHGGGAPSTSDHGSPHIPAPPGATPTSGRYTPQQAADPSTPLQVLADIAGSEPALRPYVAANPSAYPELLSWLAQLGDPAVDEALRRRRP